MLLNLRYFFISIGVFACIFVSAAGMAEEKKNKPPPKSDDPFGDLFGGSETAPSDSNALDEIRKASQEIKRGKKESVLAPKESELDQEINIALKDVFAAQRIVIHPKRGCEPAGRKKVKITTLTFDTLPAQGPPLVVCLTLESTAGREVRISTSIVGPRRKKISRAESTINFRNLKKVDHVMEYPPSQISKPGLYEYVVDIEGKTLGRLSLFSVVIDEDL